MVKKIITNQYDIEMLEDEVKLESAGEDAYFNFLYSFKQSDRIAYRKTRLCDLIYNFELDSTFPHKAHIDAFLPEIYDEYEAVSEKIKGIALHHIATSYWCGACLLKYIYERTNGAIDLEYKAMLGRTPLMAAVSGHCDNVAKVLINLGADIKAHDELKRPIAYYSIFNGTKERFEFYKSLGISFDEINNIDAGFAIAGGEADSSGLKWLINEANMDIDIKDIYGNSPLTYASRLNNEDNVKILLDLKQPTFI